jgi:hypothetical protein
VACFAMQGRPGGSVLKGKASVIPRVGGGGLAPDGWAVK